MNSGKKSYPADEVFKMAGIEWKSNLQTQRQKKFLKLDNNIKKRIVQWRSKIEALDNPRDVGKPLNANLAGLWRYRVDFYRLICSIENDKCLVLCLDICKRDVAYSKEDAKQILKTLQDYKEKEKDL